MKKENRRFEGGRGEHSKKPSEIPKRGWFEILKRVKAQVKEDHVQIVSAGVAFYLFLALFPTLAAAISVYGLLVEPSQVEAQIEQVAAMLPQEAHDAISEIARNVSDKSGQVLGWGMALSIALSLWSANKGTKALFEGLNITYNEVENRGFFKLAGVTLLFTLVAIVLGIVIIALVAGIPALSGALPLPEALRVGLNIGRWPVAALLVVLLVAYAYRVGPDRDNAQWRWVSWGSVLATIIWLIGSGLFSLYVSNFGKFGSAYGSFAAVVILMLWFFLTAFVVLLGAEINSEMEHQTEVDTTQGPEQPMGRRGAYHADHVASEDDDRDHPQ